MKVNIRQLKKWIAALDKGEDMPITKGRLGIYLFDYDWPVSLRWLLDINADFERRTSRTLSYLYDGIGYTFSEIATLLELVYIHKMLD